MAERPRRPARSLKTKQAVAALVPAVIVVLSVTGFVWAHRSVTIVVDGESRRVSTQAENVAALLRDRGVDVRRGDVVSPPGSFPLEDGMTVVVRHAVPVSVVAEGRTIELDVVGATVADALVAAGLCPSDHPAVAPGPSTELRAGMRIVVPYAFTRVVERDEPIAFETVTRPDPTRAKGIRATVTQGAEGLAQRVYRVLVTDGAEGEPQLLSERIVQAPVDCVVAVDTARSANAASRRSANAPKKAVAPPADGKRMTVAATGYAPGSDGVDWRTATGARAGYGVIAVDPDVIPLGTRMFVPGYGYGLASDTGGAIDGRRIDLCFDNRSEAIVWGRRTVDIIVLN